MRHVQRRFAHFLRAETRIQGGRTELRLLKEKKRIPGIIYDRFNFREKHFLSLDQQDVFSEIVKGPGFLNRLYVVQIYPDSNSKEPVTFKVLPRTLQLDPMTGKPLNVAFLKFEPQFRYKLEMPVTLSGARYTSGESDGGVLVRPIRTIPMYWIPQTLSTLTTPSIPCVPLDSRTGTILKWRPSISSTPSSISTRSTSHVTSPSVITTLINPHEVDFGVVEPPESLVVDVARLAVGNKKTLNDIELPAGFTARMPKVEYVVAVVQGRSRKRRVSMGQSLTDDDSPSGGGKSTGTGAKAATPAKAAAPLAGGAKAATPAPAAGATKAKK